MIAANALPPSLLRRLSVIFYDALLVVAVCILYGCLYLLIAKALFQLPSDRAQGLVFQIGFLATVFGFFCYFWRRGGQTTGMRAWNVIITTEENGIPTLAQCLVRFATAPIGWALFPTYLFNHNKQLLHDEWSHTQLKLVRKEG